MWHRISKGFKKTLQINEPRLVCKQLCENILHFISSYNGGMGGVMIAVYKRT